MSLVVTRRVTPVGKRTLDPEVGSVPPCQLLGLLHNPLELPSQTAALADTAVSKIATAGSTGRNRAKKVSGVKSIEGFYIGFPQKAVLKFRQNCVTEFRAFSGSCRLIGEEREVRGGN